MNMIQFDETGFGKGQYVDLKLSLKLAFEPTGVDLKKEPKKPTHTVYADTPHGFIDIGSLWTKIAQNGKNAGTLFHSMSLDDPSFPTMLHLKSWPTGEKGEYRLFWSRDTARDVAA